MLLSSNTFLYIEEDKIGLKSYRNIEERIFNILKDKTLVNNPKFNFQTYRKLILDAGAEVDRLGEV
jgi:hypothetical protein